MPLLSRLAVQAARAYGMLARIGSPTNVPASYLVVAGGGSGGGSWSAGGGGAGGYLTSTFTLSTLNTYSITVGAGGASTSGSNGIQGNNSVVSGTGLTTVTSIGGGFGAVIGGNGGNGGSGGGAGSNAVTSGGTATAGQGNNGGSNIYAASPYPSAGGGGAGAVGANSTSTTSGAGGNGLSSSISGSSVTYAGGGGGGANQLYGGTAGAGGTGGGGAGGSPGSNGTAGTTNTGGGGGGCGATSGIGGQGGSGIVIISYASATPKFVGGTLTTSGGNQIHTFTSSGTLSPLTPVTASYLVVAGGGGAATNIGGGGGAGGLQTGSTTLYSGATYVVTVGAGGSGGASGGDNAGSNGSNSVLSGTGLTTLTSVGGGGGGKNGTPTNAGNGGSGGGAGEGSSFGTGTSGQGNNGGTAYDAGGAYGGGGGGGAGAVGANGSSSSGGNGGVGVASSITGTSTYYAGGGGGGGIGTVGSGGNGGGGNANATSGGAGTSGTATLGGGGGAGGGSYGAGGAGGSGTVIISYAGSQVFNGGLVTSSGGNTIHTFNATGALTPVTNNLNNSLRFRASASANLQRTPSITSNRKTWTWSGWVKRGVVAGSSTYNLMTATDNTTASTFFGYGAYSTAPTDSLYFYTDASAKLLYTNAIFRDPSAWYHVVVTVDTTQATEANRIKLYVNGTQQTVTGTYPAQNADLQVNSTTYRHNIGSYYGTSAFYDGYMTDINFIDGQALEPYYFGNNDAYGNWKPIKYTGMYGTNGFYLTFADTSALTTSSNVGLGKDTSGNGNYWTTNNISITAGTTYDAMLDVPTNTSATVANYATLNPLQTGAYVTASNGNLTLTGNTSTNTAIATATISFASGKYYYEYTQGTAVSETCGFALVPVTGSLIDAEVFAANNAFGARAAGTTYGTAKIASSLTSWTSGDVVGIAIDADNGAAYWSKNGVWQTSGVPTSGASKTGAVAGWTPTASSIVTPFFGAYNSGFINVNFGQRPFTYTPPTGFVALNTYNLPTPTILQGNKYMDATLYTGTGTALNVVNAGQFKPDFVWGKDRAQAQSHLLFDSVRGVHNFLSSNSTSAESTNSTTLTAFNSNGFQLGTNATLNQSGISFVGWQWQAGQGTNTTNTAGTVTSTVSVNTTAGFSIVLYTGNGGAMTMGHGLGVAPKLIILKDRDIGRPWPVYHGSLATNQYLILNTTAAAATSTSYWNNTAPTSTVFSVNGLEGNVGANGEKYVAYCWAEIAGFSKFGSYVGNGSADGTFVYLGFRPKYVMVKKTNTGNSWVIQDASRSPFNVVDDYLAAEGSAAESTTSQVNIDFLSNGFKLRSAFDIVNAGDYIYMAFAESPFKNANAR